MKSSKNKLEADSDESPVEHWLQLQLGTDSIRHKNITRMCDQQFTVVKSEIFKMRTLLTLCLSSLVGIGALLGQNSVAQSTTSTCTLSDGKQMTIRYNSVSVDESKVRDGQVWAPGGKPPILFTQTPMNASGSEIPVGAFSLYLLPASKNWTLIVNKNVTQGSAYDQKMDLARIPLQMGEVSENNKELKLILVHAAPQQCNIRVYWAKKAGWAEFKEE